MTDTQWTRLQPLLEPKRRADGRGRPWQDTRQVLIAPHLSSRQHPTQDGRSLRRYRRRWQIERLFAWLQWFRRLVTRWEYHIENFFGMVRLGCIKLLLRHT